MAGSTRRTVGELLEYGFTDHMKPVHSTSFKVHTLYPVSASRAELAIEDQPETMTDYYQAEVVEENGCRAFVSPIFCLQ